MLIIVSLNISTKKINGTVGKAIHTGHTTYTDCYTNYRKILLIMLFIASWFKPLQRKPYRQMCTYETWVKAFLPNAHPDNLIFFATA